MQKEIDRREKWGRWLQERISKRRSSVLSLRCEFSTRIYNTSIEDTIEMDLRSKITKIPNIAKF